MTEVRSSWKLLKVSLYLLVALLARALPATAQGVDVPQLVYSHSIPVASGTAVSQDRNGFVYLLDAKQNLVRLDSLGRALDTFSPPTRGRVTTIDAWNPLKLLLFYQDRQQLLLLDRFMRPISSLDLLDLEHQGTAKAAALAANDGFWIFDETDFSILKFDLRRQEPVIESPLNLTLNRTLFDVRMLREYQNMVYLLDFNSGLYVFDNMGNYKNKIPFKGISYADFRGDELYFVQKDQLHFFNLYTLQEHTLPLPVKKNYVSAIVNSGHVFLFTKNEADIYTLE